MAVTLHTSHGEMKVEIFCDAVPRTCFNFLALAASGYYDGTLFHRNVRGFMLQGGDPTGSGERSALAFFSSPLNGARERWWARGVWTARARERSRVPNACAVENDRLSRASQARAASRYGAANSETSCGAS